MHPRFAARLASLSLIALASLLLAVTAGSALAQSNDDKKKDEKEKEKETRKIQEIPPGPLQPPVPYYGTKTLGNPPVPYPAPGTPTPRPGDWRRRIFYTGNYDWSPVIVIVNNGAPYYVPWYYLGRDYSYSGVRLSWSGQIGGFQIGVQHQTGFAEGSWYVPVFADTYSLRYGLPYQYENGAYQYRPRPVRAAPRDSDEEENQPEPRRSAPRPRASRDDGNDYYLHRKPADSPLKRDPALAQAVADIETAFRSGEIALLEKHVMPNSTLILQIQGRKRQSLAAADYLGTTREALKALKTVRYELSRVEAASRGAWMVYGEHALRGEDGTEKTFSVGFVLRKQGDNWVIAEVSAEPAKER